MGTIGQTLHFLGEFLKHPRQMGAVAPSSAALARQMVRSAAVPQADVVLEYGPGTGAFTGHILAALRPGARFVAIERNARLAALLQRRYPQARVVEGCVSLVEEICAAEGIEAADAIISGLPWAGFDESLQRRLLEPAVKVLRPGGRFVTFAYLHASRLPGGRRFRRLLEAHFAEVDVSPVVWLNLPPAFAYRCLR
ncbi:MAG: methyltransferase domain-containing protein [Candidatus Sumerlaeia bacterium]